MNRRLIALQVLELIKPNIDSILKRKFDQKGMLALAEASIERLTPSNKRLDDKERRTKVTCETIWGMISVLQPLQMLEGGAVLLSGQVWPPRPGCIAAETRMFCRRDGGEMQARALSGAPLWLAHRPST